MITVHRTFKRLIIEVNFIKIHKKNLYLYFIFLNLAVNN